MNNTDSIEEREVIMEQLDIRFPVVVGNCGWKFWFRYVQQDWYFMAMVADPQDSELLLVDLIHDESIENLLRRALEPCWTRWELANSPHSE